MSARKFYIMQSAVEPMQSELPCYTPLTNRATDVHTVPLVMASDYAALEAECERLTDELARKSVITGDCIARCQRPADERDALAAAPSAPKADDPVKQMLLEALELCERSMRSVLPDFNPFDQAAYDKARAAIAAARQEGGK